MIEFKYSKDINLLYKVHPILLLIVADSSLFFFNYKKRFIITDSLSTTEDDMRLGRVSSSHREGRAVDVRINNLDPDFVKEWQAYMDSRYLSFAAVNSKGFRKLIVLHGEGDNYHAHIQIHSSYAL